MQLLLKRLFIDGRWKNAVNMLNPLGTKGNMAKGFASLLHEMWHGDLPYLAPYSFRVRLVHSFCYTQLISIQKSVCIFAPQFGGSDQHDSQEFLSFLLDGLHEDLNRVLQKPQIETTPDREAQLETLPQQIASEQEWSIYRMRNDSLIVDYFQGQFRNRMQCMTCQKVWKCWLYSLRVIDYPIDLDDIQSLHVFVAASSKWTHGQDDLIPVSRCLREGRGP